MAHVSVMVVGLFGIIMKDRHIFILFFYLLLVSCSSTSEQKDITDEAEPTINDYYMIPRTQTEKVTTDKEKEQHSFTNKSSSLPINDGYEDGLTDGDAAAEEDRIAGRPGMQIGEDDEEEEDYDDGYDDGYDE